VRALLLVAAFLPFASVASGRTSDEDFAREMLACAHRHVIFGALSGDDNASDKATSESKAYYVAAAVKATSQDFVDREFPAVKDRTQNELLAGMRARPKAADYQAWVGQQEQQCRDDLGMPDAAPTPPIVLRKSLAANVHEIRPGASRADIVTSLGKPDSDSGDAGKGREILIYEEKVAPQPDHPGTAVVGKVHGNNCILTLEDGRFSQASCLSDVFR
jgi:hypothetical protein